MFDEVVAEGCSPGGRTDSRANSTTDMAEEIGNGDDGSKILVVERHQHGELAADDDGPQLRL